MILTTVIVTPILGFAFWCGIGGFWGVLAILFILFVSVAAIAHSVSNFRSSGVFLCRVTDESIVQSIPIKSAGESFEVNLSAITKIETHRRIYSDDGEEWYIHTESGRHMISKAYGNPDRRMGAGIQRRLPHIETIETSSKT